MMVSPTKRIVHFASPVPKSQSASPSHLKIEKFEDDLHLFGKFCPQCYKKSSQNEMLKILSLSPHLTSVHKSSAFWTAGTGWENQFSNLHHPDTNSCLILLLLTCANVAFYCDTLFVKPEFRLRIARPLCDGRPFASSPFRRLASRGLFFSRFSCSVGYSVCSFSMSMPNPAPPSALFSRNHSNIVLSSMRHAVFALSIPPSGLANVSPY